MSTNINNNYAYKLVIDKYSKTKKLSNLGWIFWEAFEMFLFDF